MEREGLDKVCGYKVDNPDWNNCPHRREVRDRTAKIKDSVLDCVGATPMIRINNITKKENI